MIRQAWIDTGDSVAVGQSGGSGLDWLIPMSESHLRAILKEWVRHYNLGRPHKSMGPGVPDPPHRAMTIMKSASRHRLGDGVVVLANSVLGGLHHEYSLALAAPE